MGIRCRFAGWLTYLDFALWIEFFTKSPGNHCTDLSFLKHEIYHGTRARTLFFSARIYSIDGEFPCRVWIYRKCMARGKRRSVAHLGAAPALVYLWDSTLSLPRSLFSSRSNLIYSIDESQRYRLEFPVRSFYYTASL